MQMSTSVENCVFISMMYFMLGMVQHEKGLYSLIIVYHFLGNCECVDLAVRYGIIHKLLRMWHVYE